MATAVSPPRLVAAAPGGTGADSTTALRRASDGVLTAVFIAVITLPAVLLMLGFPSGEVPGERPKPVPHVRIASWRTAMDAAHQWREFFESRYGLRTQLVHANAEIQSVVFSVSPSDTVFLGRDGWLYYATDGAIEDYLRETPFTDAQLEAWRTGLERVQAWHAARGIKYLFVLVPDKHLIYPEYMPDGYTPVGDTTRLEQLAQHLKTHSAVDVIELKTPLLASKGIGRLYHLTDSHWDDLGALIGDQQLVRHLSGTLPVGQPHSLADYDVQLRFRPGRDLSDLLGLARRFPEREELTLSPRFTPRSRIVLPPDPDPDNFDFLRLMTIDDPRLPRAVVFRDSFGSALMPFLAEHFSRIIFLWQKELEPRLIEREHPDIVIQELVGRRLYDFQPEWLWQDSGEWALPGQPPR